MKRGDRVIHRADRYDRSLEMIVLKTDAVVVSWFDGGEKYDAHFAPDELKVIEAWPVEPDGNRCGCILYETPPIDPVHEGVAPRDAMPACTGEPGFFDGQRVPERAEIDVEDARETLKEAGWFLVSPEGFERAEPGSLAAVLIAKGWLLVPPDESLPEDITERYVEILREHGILPMASDIDIVLAGAMVERGWKVSGGDGETQLCAPGQLTLPALLTVEAHTAALQAEGYSVVAQGELPKPICQRCEHWDPESPEPCTNGMAPDHDDPQPCEHFKHRWQDVAEHLADVLARKCRGVEEAADMLIAAGWTVIHPDAEPAAGPLSDRDVDLFTRPLASHGLAVTAPGDLPPEPLTTDQHIAALEARGYVVTTCETAPGSSLGTAWPVPPEGLEDDTLAAQLDWLRANDLPTGTGGGKKAKTTMVVRLLRHGYYDPATVEDIVGELAWPPGPAKCPVVGEDGEPCGSETPEDCEHPLP